MAELSLDPAGRPEPPAGSGPQNPVALLLYRAVALGFAILGLWVCWQSWELIYYTPVGPGPGFFPMWLGGFLTILSLGVLATSLFGHSPAFPDRIIPERKPAIEMAVTFGSIAFFALFVERLGFVPTMFLVLMTLMLVNRVALLTALLVALGGSLGVAYIFVNWLGVFIPAAPHGLLAGIGL